MRQRRVIRIALLAQIEASQLAVPSRAAVLELPDSPLVDFFLLRVQAVLFQKIGQLFIEAWVLRIAIQLPAQHLQRIRQPLQRHQPRQIPVQHLRVLAGARAARSLTASRFASRLAQRNAVRFGRQFLQQILVKRKFFLRLICPAIHVAHRERHFHPARVRRKCGEKQRSLANHGIVFAVSRVGVHQLGVQLRPLRRIRKALVNLRHKFSGFGAMEVRHGKLILGGILRPRLLRIEKQRENSVQVARPVIHRRDAFVERQVSRAQPQRLLRRGEQNARQPRQSLFVRVSSLRLRGQRVVVARRFGEILHLLQQPSQRVQLIGAPRCSTRVFALAIPGQHGLGRLHLSLLLKNVKQPRRILQRIAAAIRRSRQSCSQRIAHLQRLVAALQQSVVALD